ncbi:hypothetical protein LPW26_22700 [Rhodopseudomonas sp. HC1]|uniref:hypothetical protein n=1 Tax=Rhodopseudomonas infernalis TaxID=2897386 RepID=UPI001EE81E3E|nr:hypothetical protein [Rhodopseudomonas infernalis]MCG6207466.1 hypothetical protein [Rhodopseudomonas infernalis]
MNRREHLKLAGLAALAATAGSLLPSGGAQAQTATAPMPPLINLGALAAAIWIQGRVNEKVSREARRFDQEEERSSRSSFSTVPSSCIGV